MIAARRHHCLVADDPCHIDKEGGLEVIVLVGFSNSIYMQEREDLKSLPLGMKLVVSD
jgi:hypothetical protein